MPLAKREGFCFAGSGLFARRQRWVLIPTLRVSDAICVTPLPRHPALEGLSHRFLGHTQNRYHKTQVTLRYKNRYGTADWAKTGRKAGNGLDNMLSETAKNL